MFAPDISGAISLFLGFFLVWAAAFGGIAVVVQWLLERRLLDQDSRHSFFSIALRSAFAYPIAVFAYFAFSSHLESRPFEPNPGQTAAKLALFVFLTTLLQWVFCLVSERDRPLMASAVSVFFSVAMAFAVVFSPILVLVIIGFSKL